MMLQIESLPPSEREKHTAAEKEKEEQYKLEKKKAVEAHLKQEATTTFTAKKLQEKAATLKKTVDAATAVKDSELKKLAVDGTAYTDILNKLEIQMQAELLREKSSSDTQIEEGEAKNILAKVEESGKTGTEKNCI